MKFAPVTDRRADGHMTRVGTFITIPTIAPLVHPTHPNDRLPGLQFFRNEAGRDLRHSSREFLRLIHATIQCPTPVGQTAESVAHFRFERRRYLRRTRSLPSDKHDDDWRGPALRRREFEIARRTRC